MNDDQLNFRGRPMVVQGLPLNRRSVRRLSGLAVAVVVAGLVLFLVGASGLGIFLIVVAIMMAVSAGAVMRLADSDSSSPSSDQT